MCDSHTASKQDPMADLESDLGHFYGPGSKPRPVEKKLYKEVCRKCGGSGRWNGGFNRHGDYECFACDGRGFNEYKLSPEKREKGRQASRKRAAKKAADMAEQGRRWLEDHSEVAQWMDQNRNSFDFAESLYQAVLKYGSLTERQQASAMKCVESSRNREAKRLEREKKAAERGVSLDVTRIHDAFDAARENKVRWPKLRFAEYTFKPAAATGRNPGAIYVSTSDEGYMGKCMNGAFIPVGSCTDEQRDRIVEIASDPARAAEAYGQRFGQCMICMRELTNHASIERGIGPICASKYGW